MEIKIYVLNKKDCVLTIFQICEIMIILKKKYHYHSNAYKNHIMVMQNNNTKSHYHYHNEPHILQFCCIIV